MLGFDHGTIEDGEAQKSVLHRLKRDNDESQENFGDKLKFWEATRPRTEDIDEQIRVSLVEINIFFDK